MWCVAVSRPPSLPIAERWPRLRHWPVVASGACVDVDAAQRPDAHGYSSAIGAASKCVVSSAVCGHQPVAGLAGMELAAVGSNMRTCVVDAGAVSYLMVRASCIPSLLM
jgi:hypothetical protein